MLLARLTFTARARTRVHLPEFGGGAIRGALGYALRELACADLQRDCHRCADRFDCAYSVLFESPVPPDAAMMRRYPSAPHPIVIEPAAPGPNSYEPGQEIEFGAVLVGRALDYFPALAIAVRELGTRGLGVGRGTFDLIGIAAADEAGHGEPLYSAHDGALSARIPTRHYSFDPEADAPQSASIDLVTPTRIRFDARLRDDLQFHMLFRSLLRRVSALECFYGDGPLCADFAGLVALAERVETVDASLRWVERKRYSTRQRRPMRLGGVVGRLRVTGLSGELWPYLRVGEWVHVGKAATFGLGQYRLAASTTPVPARGARASGGVQP